MSPDRLDGEELVELISNPPSVVVVGASGDANATAGRPLRYLAEYGYRGRVTAVNPRYTAIKGVPCLPSVSELEPGAADVAMVNLPAGQVPKAIAELDERKVRAAIVIGSGFESADSAPRLELLSVLAGATLRVIGPNCVGVMTPATAAHLNFSSILLDRAPRAGRVAMVTQSGALGNSVLLSLLARGAGIANWFSTGDELSVGALELIAGLLPRADVGGLGVFLEGLTDLDWLPAVRSAIAKYRKPVFVLKAASTDLGRLAASGHTGRVVGSSDVSRAILEEAGMIEVPDLACLADVLVALDVLRTPLGARVAVVSVSGASAVISADRIRRSSNLSLADLGGAAGAELVGRLDARIHLRNPLDVPFLDETPVFAEAIIACAQSRLCDAVIAVESGLAHDRRLLAELLIAARPAAALVLSHLSEDEPIEADIVEVLARAGIAVMPTPERAVDALDRLLGGATVGREFSALSSATHRGSTLGLEALSEIAPGLPIASWRVVGSLDEARAVAREYGYPVVIKAAGRVLSHRSERGAVVTGVDADRLPDAFAKVAEVCHDFGDAVIVQKQIAPGFELLVAALLDPETGPVALVRAGGVLAELLNEQVVLWSGWDAETRRRRMAESRLGRILDGYRGGPRYDLRALNDLVDKGLAAIEAGRLSFIEFNPVILWPEGAIAVDVLAAAKEE